MSAHQSAGAASAAPAPHRAKGRLIAGLLLFLLCLASPRGQAAAPLRILFIGNSLTIAHDLPAMLVALARGGGAEPPVTRTIAVGGFSLEDHWNQGDAQRAISAGGWDVVVLQQGPSALPQSRRLLVDYTRKFATVIRAAGATPALYAVWPSINRQADFAAVSASYAAAARAANGKHLAVGDAWRQTLREHRDLALYSDDGLHPTRAGTYLAALVMHRALYGPAPAALPALGLPPAEATRLQAVVSGMGVVPKT